MKRSIRWFSHSISFIVASALIASQGCSAAHDIAAERADAPDSAPDIAAERADTPDSAAERADTPGSAAASAATSEAPIVIHCDPLTRLADLVQNGLPPEAIIANEALLKYWANTPLSAMKEPPVSVCEALQDPITQPLAEHVFSCALGPSDKVVVEFGDNASGSTSTWQGRLGLCQDWATSVPSEECRQLVSACVLAKVNTWDLHIPISLRALNEDASPPSDVPVETSYRDGTSIASFEACADMQAAAGEGKARNCGWSPRFVGVCRAGKKATLAVRTGADNEPDIMVRVCDGIYGCDDPTGANPNSGGEPEYAGMNGSVSVTSDGSVTFTCPEVGYVSVMVASADPNESVSSAVDVEPIGNQVDYPADEYQVFTVLEGVVAGDIFGSWQFDQQFACYDKLWNESLAHDAGRPCFLPGSGCFATLPQACQSNGDAIDTRSWHHPMAVYVNDPRGLSGGR